MILRRLFWLSFFLASFAAFLATHARASDTTPPVLLDWAISPVIFDTSTGNATVEWCVDASDDLSGVEVIAVDFFPPSGPGIPSDLLFAPSGCSSHTFPHGSAEGTWLLCVTVYDAINNYTDYCEPTLYPGFVENLCPFGPCTLDNVPGSGGTSTTTTTTTTLVEPTSTTTTLPGAFVLCARTWRGEGFREGAYVRVRSVCRTHEAVISTVMP